MAGGRPTKYRKNMAKKVVEVMKGGGSKTEVAAELNISKETLYQWADPKSTYFKQEFSDAITIGLVHAQSYWEKLLREVANDRKNGNATLIIFSLKNRFKEEWADIQTIDNTHKYAVSDSPQDLTDEEWIATQEPE